MNRKSSPDAEAIRQQVLLALAAFCVLLDTALATASRLKIERGAHRGQERGWLTRA